MRTAFALVVALATVSSASVGCNAIVGIPGSVTEGVADAGPDVVVIVLPPPADAAPDHATARDAGTDAGRDGSSFEIGVSSTFSEFQDWCAVTGSGAVECWGENELGQLGNDSQTPSTTPVTVALAEPAQAVSCGNATTCALTRSGAVFCWGYGSDGELGNGTNVEASAIPVAVTGLASDVVSLSMGDLTACAAKADGSAWCWGDGEGGLLGNGSMVDSLAPTEVTGLTSGVSSVSVGGYVACAVKSGGVYCWGAYDGKGGLGNGTLEGSETPVAVPSLASGVASVSVGYTFACAVTTAGAVSCWGEGDYGQLGNGEVADSATPVAVTGLSSEVVAVSAGAQTACALKSDGSVWCWGYGADGAIGSGKTDFGGEISYVAGVPVKVKDLPSATGISTGTAPCATLAVGGVDCWGFTSIIQYSAVGVSGLPGASDVTLGGSLDSTSFACARNDHLGVECWGGNADGQLGNGQRTSSNVPVGDNSIVENTTQVASGPAADFACAIVSGIVSCWGDDRVGQLGDGKTMSTGSPVSVVGIPGTATAIGVGHDSACAVVPSGKVYCWGNNAYGQLGTGSAGASSTAVEVVGLSTGATQVVVGIGCACALLTTESVECWGSNTSGQLGNGTDATTLAPGGVTGLTGVTALSMGWYTACAVTNGQVACWGDDVYGELGDGATGTALTPHVVSGTSGATAIAVGQQSACAIVGGGVQCWGSLALGTGVFMNAALPTPVKGLTGTATSVAVGSATACAVVSGSVQCWGYDTSGQLGDGAAANALTPLAIQGFP